MSEFLEPDDFPEDEVIAEIYLHIIFWTLKLRPGLTRDMLSGACEAMDQAMFTVEGEALAAGGTPDHLHILARLSPDHSVQEALDALRKASTAWAVKAGGAEDLAWSQNDVAVGISTEHIKQACEFIASQQAHHEIVSFQSELTGILDENGIEYEERELWEE